MHGQAWIYISERVNKYGPFSSVVEFGGANVNGTVRELFLKCPNPRCSAPTETDYLIVDIQDGPGVDIVCDAATFRSERKYDVAVCCEVLEHTAQGAGIVESAYKALRRNGYFLLTCATDPRVEHNGWDGGRLREGEFYRNVSVSHLSEWLVQAGFHTFDIQVDGRHGDLYLTAVKGEELPL